MKNLIFLCVFTVCSCQNVSSKKVESANVGFTKTHEIISDSITVPSNDGDTYKYSAIEFDEIKTKNPVFFSKTTKNPEATYNENADFEKFGSEAGIDEYYTLYAYFLRQKNGEENTTQIRENLSQIFESIHLVYGVMNGGGIFFGHQAKRSLAYVEYEISLVSVEPNEYTKVKINQEKKNLFLQALKEMIKVNIGSSKLGNERMRNKMSQLLLDEIAKIDAVLISDYYLEIAEEIQHQFYDNLPNVKYPKK